MPVLGQVSKAARKASPSASSAAATLRDLAARKGDQPAIGIARGLFDGLMGIHCRRPLPAGLHVRPHLDHALRAGGVAGRPLQGRVEIRHVDDEEAAQLLLGVGIGAVLDQALAALQLDRGCRFRRFQPGTADDDAGFLQTPSRRDRKRPRRRRASPDPCGR